VFPKQERSFVRRILAGTLGIAGWGLLMTGCAEQEKRLLSHLPDPALHSMPPKPKATIQPPQITRKGLDHPQVPGEPGWMPAGGISDRWECIVIHHSDSPSGNAADFDRWHRQRGWDELGYHFVIDNGAGGPDGRVEVGSRWEKQKHGAHCKVPGNYYNEHGIGICLVGNFDASYPSARQMESLRRLMRFLMAHTGIPPSRVLGHGEANGGNTRCPGRNFPMAQLRSSFGNGRLASGQ